MVNRLFNIRVLARAVSIFSLGGLHSTQIKQSAIQQLLYQMLLQQQSPTISVPEDNAEVQALKASIKALTEQNQSIKKSLVDAEKLLSEERSKVEEFKKQLLQKEEIIEQQKSKMDEEQSKISKLTIQLGKVEKLLQKLLNKKQKDQFSYGSYFTPQVDKYRKGYEASSKFQQKYGMRSPQNYNISSHRSSKTQFSSSKKSPIVGSSSYISKIGNSPSTSSYHQYGSSYNNQSQQFKKFRRQMLMESKNVQDVLKYQKIMMSKHSHM